MSTTNPSRLPVNAETRQAAADLMTEGLTRNAIARQLGISTGTVSSIADAVGHTFDRTQTELATRARQIDLAAARMELALKAAVRAEEALEQMDAPVIAAQFEAGGEHTVGGWREHVLQEPSIGDQRNLATIFGIMVDKVAVLSRPLAGSTSADALSVLERIGDGIAESARTMRAEGIDPTEEPGDDVGDAYQ